MGHPIYKESLVRLNTVDYEKGFCDKLISITIGDRTYSGFTHNPRIVALVRLLDRVIAENVTLGEISRPSGSSETEQ
jgi:hypothetical protein